jgi:TonB family protein
MSHGIREFFLERARCRMRVSVLCVSVGLSVLAVMGISQIPLVRRGIAQLPILRFGVAGEPRYVPLVRLEAEPGQDEPLLHVGEVLPVREGGGTGRGDVTVSRSLPQPGRTGPRVRGPGEAAQSLVARAIAGQGRVPIFQSDELIIEQLVRPEYPEDARQRGIEGKVAVLALVDTAGAVVEAQVMTASGEAQLDRAAEVAVRQCRFRPYRVGGETREVYAVFRFAFRIY